MQYKYNSQIMFRVFPKDYLFYEGDPVCACAFPLGSAMPTDEKTLAPTQQMTPTNV